MAETRKSSVEFKVPFIIIRSSRFSGLFDRLGRLRVMGALGWVALIALPVMAGFGILLIISSIVALISRPEVQAVQRESGPGVFLLIPGINPYIPLLYGWFAIVVAIMVHEGAHAALARNMGYNVKSSGLLLFLGIPIGAFVELDERELKEGRWRDVSRTLSGGPAANMAVALASLVLLLVLVNGIIPLTNIVIYDVAAGSPAEEAGLARGDAILAVDGFKVLTIEQLSDVLSHKKVGDAVTLLIARGEGLKERSIVQVRLADLGDGRPRMGVIVQTIGTVEYLEAYKTLAISNPLIHFIPPSFNLRGAVVHPYSDAINWLYTHSSLGELYKPISDFLFWMWFVNVNVAIFNALPIYPLDGGQALKKLLSSLRVNERAANGITMTVTLLMLGLIASLIMIPYIGIG